MLSPTCRSLRYTGLVLLPAAPSKDRQGVSGSCLHWRAEGILFCRLDLLLLPPGPPSPATWKATALYVLPWLHDRVLISGGHGMKALENSYPLTNGAEPGWSQPKKPGKVFLQLQEALEDEW